MALPDYFEAQRPVERERTSEPSNARIGLMDGDSREHLDILRQANTTPKQEQDRVHSQFGTPEIIDEGRPGAKVEEQTSNEKPEITKNSEGDRPDAEKYYDAPKPPYAALWGDGTKVVSIGDLHQDPGHAKDLFEAMMKELGQNQRPPVAVVMEFVPLEIGNPPGTLNGPLSEENRNKIRAALSGQAANFYPDSEEGKQEKEEEFVNKYMEMIETALDANVTIIGAEPNVQYFGEVDAALRGLPQGSIEAIKTMLSPDGDKNRTEQARIELEQDLREHLPEFTQEKIDHFFEQLKTMSETKPLPQFTESGDLNEMLQNWRNSIWATKADEHLQSDADARVIIFAGALHFGKGTPVAENGTPTKSVTELLNEKGIKNKTIGWSH